MFFDPDFPSNIFLAVLLVGALAWIGIRFIGPRGFMDIPGGRRKHPNPVPRVGGIAFFVAYLLLSLFIHTSRLLSPIELAAIIGIFIIGVLDDRFELRALWKAFLGLGLAILLAWDNIEVPSDGLDSINLLCFELSNTPIERFVLLVILFWTLPQAFNLIDGANGLAIGTALISSAFLIYLGALPIYVISLLGTLLLFNWPRAHLFLGDAGSLTLGLLLAIISAHAFDNKYPNGILWLFAYPILDVLQVILTRLTLGNSIFKADRNHLHHHLREWLGYQIWMRAPIVWVLSAGCASGTVLSGYFRVIPWTSLIFLFLLVSACYISSIRDSYKDRKPGPGRYSTGKFALARGGKH